MNLVKKLGKRVALLVAVALLLSTVLSACSNNSNADVAKAKGRYVESEVTLPKQMQEEQIFQMVRSESGLPVILTYSGKEQAISQYSLDENGKWSKEPLSWINKLGENPIDSPKLLTDTKGNQYFYYNQSEGNVYMCHLLVKSRGDSKDITLADWQKLIDDSYYNIPRGVAVLENGNIVAQTGLRLNIYNPQTGEIIDGVDVANDYDASIMQVNGNQVVVPRIDGNSLCVTGVGVFNGEDIQSAPESVDYDGTTQSYSNQLTVNDQDDIIMLDTEGIHVLKNKTTLWNTVVVGAMNTMYMPTVGCIGLIEDNDSNYYAAYSGEGYQLMKYSYDKDMATIPENELSIYTLEDNSMLRQAAVKFSQSNPNVMVSIHVAMTGDNVNNKEDYIKALNTKLLSGSGEDILMLDGLPTDSYIEKSVLLDLSDVLKPLIESNELLGKVMDDFNKDGKIYSVPTRILPYVSFTKKEITDSSTTIKELVTAAGKDWKHPILGPLTSGELMNLFLPIAYNDIIDDTRVINKENLIAFLEDMKKIYDNTGVKEHADGSGPLNAFSLPSSMEMSVEKLKGMYDMNFNIAVVDMVKGSYQGFENAYNPYGVMGINAASKQKDFAKQFIELLLSKDTQSHDYFTGFPVTVSALDEWLQMQGEASYTEIADENGEYVPFSIEWLGESERRNVIDLCKNVDKRARVDDTVLKVISEKSNDYFLGEADVNETVDLIVNELSLYLSE